MNHQHPLAYHDEDFLESTDARPIRILAEYLEPMRRFKQQNIQDTVVFFGSARVHSRKDAERALLKLTSSKRRRTSAHTAALRRGRKAVEWSRYYEDARELAHKLTAWSLSLEEPRRRFVVCSGGGPGIMEAANRGAHEAGGKSVGLNIRLPFEQPPNQYITEGLQFEFHYFFMRKFWFAYLAKALVVFPGDSGRSTRCSRFSRSRRHASCRRNCSWCSTAAITGTRSSICGRWSSGARLKRRTSTCSTSPTRPTKRSKP